MLGYQWSHLVEFRLIYNHKKRNQNKTKIYMENAQVSG